MNKILLIGRLCNTPELKYTPTSNVAVCSFRLAVDRKYKDNAGNKTTDFIPCTVWKQQAEFLNRYTEKGSLIAIEGSLQIRQWQTQDGANRQSAEVLCENIQILKGKTATDTQLTAEPINNTNNEQTSQFAPKTDNNDIIYDPFAEE